LEFPNPIIIDDSGYKYSYFIYLKFMSLNTPAMFTYVSQALTCSGINKNSLNIPEYQNYYKSYRGEAFSIISIIYLGKNKLH